jgi:hypothetical protein
MLFFATVYKKPFLTLKTTIMANFEEFKKRAEEKGFNFILDPENKINIESPSEIHVDMVMVDLSIKSAIKNAKTVPLQQKLTNLLAKGTNAQKLDFVYGTGTYYFPEDLEIIAAYSLSKETEAKICHRVCETVCYELCRCLLADQICRIACKKVCEIICD